MLQKRALYLQVTLGIEEVTHIIVTRAYVLLHEVGLVPIEFIFEIFQPDQ